MTRKTKSVVEQAVGAANWMKQIVVCVGGLYLLAAFAFDGQAIAAAYLCIVAFVAGGIRLSLGHAAGGREVRVDVVGAVAFGAALAFGPYEAAGPAAMAALGAILLMPGRREPFSRSVYHAARLPVAAAAASLVFAAAGGEHNVPASAASFPAAVAAAAAYSVAERVLATDAASLPGLSLTLGMGYLVGGVTRALPGFAILVPMLPIGVVALRELRRLREPGLPSAEESVPPPPDQAAKPALIDDTTGLANQRYLQMFLQQEISRSERSGQAITLLLVDLDDFSSVNGGLGTDAGDRCLAAIGVALRGMVRDYDLVARYKDDEFVIVLPETDASAGSETALRLHRALSGQVLPARARFSVGVATYPNHGAAVDDLLSSAHHALNRAKFSGKNKVRSCHELAKAS